MAFAVKTKKPFSDDTESTDNTKFLEVNKGFESEPSTSYEVFRNNTTAVEVIVKEVMNKNTKKKMLLEPNANIQTIKRLQEEVRILQDQLANTNSILTKSRHGYRLIITELKKQIDDTNRIEMERQKINMTLLLENEKLKTLLQLKTNLISKFKRELNSMKKILKLVIKNMTSIPRVSDNAMSGSEPEFDDFERDLKKEIHAKLKASVFEGTGTTFDSSVLKDTKDSFDKHY